MGKSTFVAYLDAEKAFDRIDHDLLLYKLLQNGIYGHVYENVKTIYSESTCSVKVNEMLTDWFITKSSVRQGDTLSPTLFCIFINDIVHEVNNLNLCINIGNRTLSILLCADDIVSLSDTEEALQNMLNTVYTCSVRNMIKFNDNKSKIAHYRKPSIPQTTTTFFLVIMIY